MELHNKDDTINKFKKELEDLADLNDICPRCGNKIKCKTKQSYLAEAWGKDVYEDITVNYCTNSDCGWTSE